MFIRILPKNINLERLYISNVDIIQILNQKKILISMNNSNNIIYLKSYNLRNMVIIS